MLVVTRTLGDQVPAAGGREPRAHAALIVHLDPGHPCSKARPIRANLARVPLGYTTCRRDRVPFGLDRCKPARRSWRSAILLKRMLSLAAPCTNRAKPGIYLLDAVETQEA